MKHIEEGQQTYAQQGRLKFCAFGSHGFKLVFQFPQILHCGFQAPFPCFQYRFPFPTSFFPLCLNGRIVGISVTSEEQTHFQ